MKKQSIIITCLVFMFSIIIVSIPVKQAYACSCMAPPGALEARDNSQAVFSGKVMDIQPASLKLFGGSSADPLAVTFEVDQAWKGVNSKEFVVYTAESEASCGFTFQKNSSYLVYANENEGKYDVSLCSRTAPISAAADDVKMLGAGIVPTGDLGDNEHWFFDVWPYLLASVVILLGVLYFILKQNKKTT